LGNERRLLTRPSESSRHLKGLAISKSNCDLLLRRFAITEGGPLLQSGCPPVDPECPHRFLESAGRRKRRDFVHLSNKH
jgi:hypothetical protein